MVDYTLFWYLLIPVIASAFTIYLTPRVSNNRFSRRDVAILALIGMLISTLILGTAFYLGKGSKTGDQEILNGEVVNKTREHDEYQRSYDCNCRETCTGSGQDRKCDRKCDTCYEDHYTVTWNCHTTLGTYRIHHLDWTNRNVYREPDPARYTSIVQGDPVAKKNSYTNYIKAVPDTLFRPAQESIKKQFALDIPEYPLGIYDFYKIDRVIPVGVNLPNRDEWNYKLSTLLKTLGPVKQANAVIVITKIRDPNYFYALQDAWLNGKKNDIVLVISAPDFPKKAAWVNVMALTQSNIFQVTLRDEISNLENLDVDSVLSTLNKVTLKHFTRKRMRDFEYLDGEIDPPEWVMLTAAGLILTAYLGFFAYVWYSSRSVSNRSQSRYNSNRSFR